MGWEEQIVVYYIYIICIADASKVKGSGASGSKVQ